jgi:hypothetical protein
VEHCSGESFRWKGKYSYDLQSRETLETRLGVFADFVPKLPPSYADRTSCSSATSTRAAARGARQGASARLVACDTMNYWIQSKREALLELLKRVDVLLVNDGEARELSATGTSIGRPLDPQAGPKRVVIKQGEYGALLMGGGRTFYTPAFPLERCSTPPVRATPSRAASWATWRASASSTIPNCAAPWCTAA